MRKIKDGFWSFERVTRLIELLFLLLGLIIAYLGLNQLNNFVDITARSAKFQSMEVSNDQGGIRIIPGATTTLEFGP